MSRIKKSFVNKPDFTDPLQFLILLCDSEIKNILSNCERQFYWDILYFRSDLKFQSLTRFILLVLCSYGFGGRYFEKLKENRCPLFNFIEKYALYVRSGDEKVKDDIMTEALSTPISVVRELFGPARSVFMYLGLFDYKIRSIELWAEVEKVHQDASDVHVVSTEIFEKIGHYSIFCALVIDSRRRGRSGPFFVSSSVRVANRFLHERLFELPVSSPDPEAQPGSRVFVHPVIGPRPYSWEGQAVSLGTFISRAIDSHFRSSGAALIDIRDDDRRTALDVLDRAGIDPTARIVTLHVREARFNAAVNLRNAPISDYVQAIEFLTASGYQVVRLGDRSMTRLGNSAGFFDYAHSEHKPELADIVLASMCHFHIGTSSGMSHIPILFDRPVLYTNWMPYGEYIWSRRSMVLPKAVIDRRTGKVVPIDLCQTVFENTYWKWYFEWKGCMVQNNSPADIVSATRDIIASIDTPLSDAEIHDVRFAPSFEKKLSYRRP